MMGLERGSGKGSMVAMLAMAAMLAMTKHRETGKMRLSESNKGRF